MSELHEYVEIPDGVTRYSGNPHISCFHGGTANMLLYIIELKYNTAIARKGITIYRMAGITTTSIIRVREDKNGQRN